MLHLNSKQVKRILTVLFLMYAAVSHSQWVQLTDGIGNDKVIYALSAIGNEIYCGTSGHWVYKSANNGVNWTQPFYSGGTVHSLAAYNNNIYAGALDNGVYFSSNAGINWSQIPLDAYSVTVVYSAGNFLLAGTEINGLFKTTNNGINWTKLNNQGARSLFVSGDIIVEGTSGSTMLSTNNGINWTQSYTYIGEVNALAGKGTILFAGNTNMYPSPYDIGGVYYSANYGQSWTLSSLSHKTVFAIAANGNLLFSATQGNGVFLSTNDGANWQQINTGFPAQISVYSLLIKDNYIFAGTYGNSVWRRPLSDLVGVINTGSEIPSSFSLYQNYPNPFNPSTTIKFDIPKSSAVRLSVYDITGREIEMLVNDRLNAGSYETKWDASKYASGTYFCIMRVDESIRKVTKMILLK